MWERCYPQFQQTKLTSPNVWDFANFSSHVYPFSPAPQPMTVRTYGVDSAPLPTSECDVAYVGTVLPTDFHNKPANPKVWDFANFLSHVFQFSPTPQPMSVRTRGADSALLFTPERGVAFGGTVLPTDSHRPNRQIPIIGVWRTSHPMCTRSRQRLNQ